MDAGAGRTYGHRHDIRSANARQGEAIWWFDSLAEIKATAADTGGLMTIVQMTEPPNAATPLHVHHGEDEAFWILAGDVTIEVGDTTIECHAGDCAFGPARHPAPLHRRRGRLQDALHPPPGGFEGLVRDMGRPARARTLPEPSMPDLGHVAAVAQKYNCELLG